VVFFLGQAATKKEIKGLLSRYTTTGQLLATLETVRESWNQRLNTIQIQTPNRALDLLVNRWVLYQVVSCRLWGRSAFYQSGGAFGFRDQLQDAMALVYTLPAETRAHLLRAAGRQFLEGDVQHWWHPPAGRGVRTRCSDDFLWLPFAVYHYVAVTGDQAVLDEAIPFLKAPVLRPEQLEDFGLPESTSERRTLYEHCLLALEQGRRLGPHGLPLIGTGDWNDGMNRVGAGGKGESVWNGWFQIMVNRQFAELAESRGDIERAAWCRHYADQLRAAIEEHAWDGSWYRRAFFDDGTPLGSARNEECSIDSIAQSWAVISGAAPPERAAQCMAAVEEHLVRSSDRLILLFTPPFDKSGLNPGYVKGYVPGIRENGGQYTHAAIWAVQAAALLGQGTKAMEWLDLLNPILHTATPEQAEKYRVEPYVVAADIYSEAPHTGRGGWTWYTGSAGWFYRVALETILGFHLRGNRLTLRPCIPHHWRGFTIQFQHHSSNYSISVENPRGVESGVKSVAVDGKMMDGVEIHLVDDAAPHRVQLVMGK
jgi:cyclic beta-1,2-glucan synthetase